MSKTITAKFDSIDAATIAASNAKDRFENISSVKVKYKTEQDEHEVEPFIFSGGFAAVNAADVSTPSVLQNGMYPVAVNIDAINDSRPARTKKATVEITAKGTNVDPICSTLRQGGGVSLKVR